MGGKNKLSLCIRLKEGVVSDDFLKVLSDSIGSNFTSRVESYKHHPVSVYVTAVPGAFMAVFGWSLQQVEKNIPRNPFTLHLPSTGTYLDWQGETPVPEAWTELVKDISISHQQFML